MLNTAVIPAEAGTQGVLPFESRAGDRLAGFPRFLRANGFGVGAGDGAEVLRVADAVGVLDPSLLRWSLKALLCGRCDEWRRFDSLFDAWFLPANRWAAPSGEPWRPTVAGRAPWPTPPDATRPTIGTRCARATSPAAPSRWPRRTSARSTTGSTCWISKP
ncbi:hypothetical protein [Ramlibacter montanisoli]|uniref:hypothetical protein n=1 Tax=Ramlibacter montanisoli TaxID=2732512 RepID=UPI00209C3AB0|nr:hypothetical protein [Ramlibacter montanisoli]